MRHHPLYVEVGVFFAGGGHFPEWVFANRWCQILWDEKQKYASCIANFELWSINAIFTLYYKDQTQRIRLFQNFECNAEKNIFGSRIKSVLRLLMPSRPSYCVNSPLENVWLYAELSVKNEYCLSESLFVSNWMKCIHLMWEIHLLWISFKLINITHLLKHFNFPIILG